MSDSLGNQEFNNFASITVSVNDPVAVYFLTGDGKFAYVKSSVVSGWVPYEATGEKIYLEASSCDLDISEKNWLWEWFFRKRKIHWGW